MSTKRAGSALAKQKESSMTRIEEIQNRLSAATPGPWKAQNLEQEHGHGGVFWVSVDRPDEIKTVAEVDANDDGVEAVWRFADATFIANAPADVTFLLAELRKAHEALARVEALAGELATHSEGRGLDYSDDDFDRGWHGANRAAVDQLRAAVAAANGDGNG